MQNKIFMICCFVILNACLFFSCNHEKKYLTAELIAVIDDYPYEYSYYKDSIDYSRKICFVFKIKNNESDTVFVPINDELKKNYHSSIMVSASNGKIVSLDAYFKNLINEINPNDSALIYVRLYEKQMNKLGFESYVTPPNLVEKIKFNYFIDERDKKRSISIPNIIFTKGSQIKYLYRQVERIYEIE